MEAPQPEVAGTLFGFRGGLTSNGGVITVDDENLNGRMTPTYAGITTTLSAAVINATTDEVNLTNISKLDVRIGDFLMINDELVRVKTTVSGNPINVFRGVLGTRPTAHSMNDVVRRVKVNPIELRRHSINRASGHTFEYVGLVLVTTLLHFQIDMIVLSQQRKNSLHNHQTSGWN